MQIHTFKVTIAVRDSVTDDGEAIGDWLSDGVSQHYGLNEMMIVPISNEIVELGDPDMEDDASIDAWTNLAFNSVLERMKR